MKWAEETYSENSCVTLRTTRVKKKISWKRTELTSTTTRAPCKRKFHFYSHNFCNVYAGFWSIARSHTSDGANTILFRFAIRYVCRFYVCDEFKWMKTTEVDRWVFEFWQNKNGVNICRWQSNQKENKTILRYSHESQYIIFFVKFSIYFIRSKWSRAVLTCVRLT